MRRTLGIGLILLSLLAVFAELMGLQLPTLRDVFEFSRELPFLHYKYLNIEQNEIVIPIFGYLFYLCLIIVGVCLLVKSLSQAEVSPITKRRIQRFKEIKRGYVSLWILLIFIFLAFLDHLLVGNKALIVKYEGGFKFPAIVSQNYSGCDFGQEGEKAHLPADYRSLKTEFSTHEENWVIMPLISYQPTQDKVNIPVRQLEIRNDGKLYQKGKDHPYNGLATTLYTPNDATQSHLRIRYRDGLKDGDAIGKNKRGTQVYKAYYNKGQLVEESEKWSGDGQLQVFLNQTSSQLYQVLYYPAPPNSKHILGTDSAGNDLLAYLYGGLQVNIRAAIILVPAVYIIGATVGLLMGYFGGFFDLLVQRIIEVLSNIPLLFVLIIVSSSIPEDWRGLGAILLILITFGWMGLTYLMRTAAYREKARDYVQASRVMGASTPRIIFKHILPNTMAILVTLMPFSVSGVVMAITSLDYLGFGLPVQYASWGALLKDGLANMSSPWLVSSAFLCLVTLLTLITFVGEGVREAFDPKQYTIYK